MKRNREFNRAVLFSVLFLPLLLLAAGDLQASVLVPQVPLPGGCIPKFAVPLPVFGPGGIPRVNTSEHPYITVTMSEFDQQVLPSTTIDTSLCEDVLPGWPSLPSKISFGPTRVWGYGVQDTETGSALACPLWPGVTLENARNAPVTVKYVNRLPAFNPANISGPPYDYGLVAGLLTYDQTIHWADPLGTTMNYKCMDGPPYAPQCLWPYLGPIPVVPHLHGQETPSFVDGTPEQWFTPNGITGKNYFSAYDAGPGTAVYKYLNTQEPGTLWFHEHSLGVTRNNFYAGLEAFYFIRDYPNEPQNLPTGPYEIELMLQDRQFDIGSQLFFPDGSGPNAAVTNLNGTPPNPDVHPYWVPEFVGDVAIVNGAPWPYLNVEPRRYLFRLLDGANARFFHFDFGGAPMYLIGADDNYFDEPQKIDSLTIAPGQRLYVIVDFAGFEGQTLVMNNDAPVPFPGGLVPGVDPGQRGMSRIMQFRVASSTSSKDQSCNPAPCCDPFQGYYGECKRPHPIVDMTWHEATIYLGGGSSISFPTPGVLIDQSRQLVLKEIEGAGGPLMVLLNNTRWNGLLSPSIAASYPDDGISELPQQGSIEQWEIINLTADAHPIHTHLAQFQLLNRETLHFYYPTLYETMFGQWEDVPLLSGCVPRSFCPGYGPPLPYEGSTNFFNAVPLSLQQGGDYAIGGNPFLNDQGWFNPMHLNDLAPSVNPIPPEDMGWRDTIIMPPGQITRIIIRWQPTDSPLTYYESLAGQNLYPFEITTGPGYVWHCHILDHEDNEMMRPYKVVP